jgi:hypothetical protein
MGLENADGIQRHTRAHVLCHPEDIPPLNPTSGSLCRCTPRRYNVQNTDRNCESRCPIKYRPYKLDGRLLSEILYRSLFTLSSSSMPFYSPSLSAISHFPVCSPTVRLMALALPLREPPAFLNARRSGHLQSQPTRNQPASSPSSSPSCHPNPHMMGLEKTPHTLPDRMSPPSSRTSSPFPPR